jgi:hypothetical protein
MAFKLLDTARARRRRINGHELVALVRAGATFIDGHLQVPNRHRRSRSLNPRERRPQPVHKI